MKELREFIKNLKRLEYGYVSLEEVFGDGDEKLINLKDILSSIKKLGVKEVVAEYFESFEFITSDGRYLEINAIY
jgi:predicted RNA-binding protein with EMAP domain